MHVVVADTDTSVVRSIQALFTDASHEVTAEENAIDLFRRVIINGADAVILDTELPDVDGIRLCEELRAHGYTGIIMFLSHDHETTTVVTAFRAGADDYLVKPFNPLELLLRVERFHHRIQRPEDLGDAALLTVGEAELSLGELTYRVAGREPVKLTPTEMRMLEVLMRNAEAPVSRRTLIERIWGYTFELDTNRIDVYIRRLRRKIEANPDNPLYLHTVRGRGYVFTPPDARVT